MSDEYKNLTTMASAFLDSFNAGNLDAMMEFFDDEDCVYEDPTGGIHKGKAAVRAALEPNFTGAWGKIRYDLEDLVADPHKNTALAYWTLSMTRGDRTKRLRGTDILKFRNGKLISKLCYVKAKQTLVV